jgi:predicted component of type VI protein secretion system
MSPAGAARKLAKSIGADYFVNVGYPFAGTDAGSPGNSHLSENMPHRALFKRPQQDLTQQDAEGLGLDLPWGVPYFAQGLNRRFYNLVRLARPYGCVMAYEYKTSWYTDDGMVEPIDMLCYDMVVAADSQADAPTVQGSEAYVRDREVLQDFLQKFGYQNEDFAQHSQDGTVLHEIFTVRGLQDIKRAKATFFENLQNLNGIIGASSGPIES